MPTNTEYLTNLTKIGDSTEALEGFKVNHHLFSGAEIHTFYRDLFALPLGQSKYNKKLRDFLRVLQYSRAKLNHAQFQDIIGQVVAKNNLWYLKAILAQIKLIDNFPLLQAIKEIDFRQAEVREILKVGKLIASNAALIIPANIPVVKFLEAKAFEDVSNAENENTLFTCIAVYSRLYNEVIVEFFEQLLKSNGDLSGELIEISHLHSGRLAELKQQTQEKESEVLRAKLAWLINTPSFRQIEDKLNSVASARSEEQRNPIYCLNYFKTGSKLSYKSLRNLYISGSLLEEIRMNLEHYQRLYDEEKLQKLIAKIKDYLSALINVKSIKGFLASFFPIFPGEVCNFLETIVDFQHSSQAKKYTYKEIIELTKNYPSITLQAFLDNGVSKSRDGFLLWLSNFVVIVKQEEGILLNIDNLLEALFVLYDYEDFQYIQQLYKIGDEPVKAKIENFLVNYRGAAAMKVGSIPGPVRNNRRTREDALAHLGSLKGSMLDEEVARAGNNFEAVISAADLRQAGRTGEALAVCFNPCVSNFNEEIARMLEIGNSRQLYQLFEKIKYWKSDDNPQKKYYTRDEEDNLLAVDERAIVNEITTKTDEVACQVVYQLLKKYPADIDIVIGAEKLLHSDDVSSRGLFRKDGALQTAYYTEKALKMKKPS